MVFQGAILHFHVSFREYNWNKSRAERTHQRVGLPHVPGVPRRLAGAQTLSPSLSPSLSRTKLVRKAPELHKLVENQGGPAADGELVAFGVLPRASRRCACVP